MVAYPDRGAGNDPEPFFFFFFFFRGVGSLSQPRLNIFTVGNMRVMICLGQGGLRSLSASSCIVFNKKSARLFQNIPNRTEMWAPLVSKLVFGTYTGNPGSSSNHSMNLK